MKKISGLILTGVLASSIALIAGCSSDAETTQTEETTTQTTEQAPEQPAGNRMDMFAGLDEETKAKAEEIMIQMREGTITSEEAEAQLAELGVDLPIGGGAGGGPGSNMFSNLDEETRAKAEEIMSAMREGTITREEAVAQLAELGVEMPSMPEMPDTSETSEDT
ncbi:hypothetical protein ACEWK1_26645, partial [Metabacillus sp. YM-086]